MAEGVVREKCSEESDEFVDALVNLVKRPQSDIFKAIASTKARNMTKCIHKQFERKEESYEW